MSRIKIMGILNVTPDSFFDGGRYNKLDNALKHALNMVDEGAEIIDVGGESTRPGAEAVDTNEELDRVIPVIEKLRQESDVKISVDTTKSEVAEEALKNGADIINDISGLKFDSRIADIAADYKSDLILMHTTGTPKDMQKNIKYVDFLDDICSSLNSSVLIAKDKGVNPSKIIIDPGIGFGKTVEQNYIIINSIKKFKEISFRVLIGLSRKSLIWKLYENKEIDRLPATVSLNMISVYNGADIIRVHDVREHRLALKTVEFLMEHKGNANILE